MAVVPNSYIGSVVTRADAIMRGQRHYFTGLPCRHGHVCLRLVSSRGCLLCGRESVIRRRPLSPIIPLASSLERMFENCIPEPNSGCWLWMGYVSATGYGRVPSLENSDRSRQAHRVAYELVHGPIPPGLEPDHLCRVRCCINPDHIEPVTRQLNTLRGLRGKSRPARLLAEFVHDLARGGYPLSTPLAAELAF